MKEPGAKTEEPNSASMNVKSILFFFFLATLPLYGAPAREGVPLQELRIQCEGFGHSLHTQKVELEILQEKLQTLETTIATLRQELGSPKTHPELVKDRLTIFEKRVSTLEKTQESVVSDLKLLKNHFNESSLALTSCQQQLALLEKQLSQEVVSLKNSLHSMIALLQKGESFSDKAYTVKPGDSLGKIALEQKIDIKRLKELNHLSNDRIFVGQKLQLP